jgi:hypothetical protein
MSTLYAANPNLGNQGMDVFIIGVVAASLHLPIISIAASTWRLLMVNGLHLPNSCMHGIKRD